MTIDDFLAQYAANQKPATPLDPNSFDSQFAYQNALNSQNQPQTASSLATQMSQMDRPYAERLSSWDAASPEVRGSTAAPTAPEWMSGLLAQDPSKWANLNDEGSRLPIDEQQFIWDNGSAANPGTKAYTDLHGMADSGSFTDQRPQQSGGWLDANLVPILAAALVGGATMGAGAGGAGGGAAEGGGGSALAGGADGMLLDTGGMGLTGAGGIGSASSLADAGVAGWGAGTGTAATGAGAGLGAHFSDAGFAAENPELALDQGYVGSGTGSGWDAGVTDGGADYSNEGNHYQTPESTQGPGGSPVNATTAGTSIPGLSSLQQKIASQLLKTGLGALTGGGSGASGSGSGGMFGSSGVGYTPNELTNETPGMIAGAAAPQAQAQQAGSPHFLGGAQQPQLQGVGYMQVPQAQDPSQMMKLAQALQGQDQNYG